MSTEQPSPYLTSIASHAGEGGKNNEDRYRIESRWLGDDKRVPSVFAVLADGVGSSRAGQVAAELTTEAIYEAIAIADGSQPTGILQSAIFQASQVVLQRADTRKEWKGMGSTCLCAWVIGGRLYAASVGNSRLYLQRGEHLQQLNVLHQMPRERKADELAATKRGVKADDLVRGYLGSKSPVEPDLRLVIDPDGRPSARHQGLRLLPNDRLLLCSDGLGDELDPFEIAQVLGSGPIEDSAEDLLHLALKRNVPDNLTAIVIAMPPAKPPLQVAPSRPRRLARLAILLLLALAAALAWYASQNQINPLEPPTATPLNTLTPLPTNTPLP